MMTVDETKKLLNDTEEFIKAKPEGVVDEATKRKLALSLALRIVEFEKSCKDIGLDNCITYTAEEITDLLINDPHRFLRWLENKKFDFIAEVRYKASEKGLNLEKTAEKNEIEFD